MKNLKTFDEFLNESINAQSMDTLKNLAPIEYNEFADINSMFNKKAYTVIAKKLGSILKKIGIIDSDTATYEEEYEKPFEEIARKFKASEEVNLGLGNDAPFTCSYDKKLNIAKVDDGYITAYVFSLK